MPGLIAADRFAGASAIDFFAMSDAQYQHKKPVVFDFADETVIAQAIFPELTKERAVQGFTDAVRVVERGNSGAEEPQDTAAMLRVEFAELPV